MRETIHRVTCDICGRSQTDDDYTGWKELNFDDFGCLRARYLDPKDTCPECFKRLRATVMEIRKEAGLYAEADES